MRTLQYNILKISGLMLLCLALISALGCTEPATEEAPSVSVFPAPPEQPPNLLIFMIDTLRADRLGAYGGVRPVSPHIDALAEQSVLFENAIAQSSWTRPTVASLFTGLHPRTHGANQQDDTLAPAALTLAEILQASGYRTGGFIANPNVTKKFGFGQGFETYQRLQRDAAGHFPELAASWLDQEEPGEAPFFLYLHTVDPHGPYEPRNPWRERFAPRVEEVENGIGSRPWLRSLRREEIPVDEELVDDLFQLYDAEIAANDAALGALLGILEERSLLENTVIIVVSDHGEEFYEHGRWEHGQTLHSEVLHVPLIIRFPGWPEGRRVAEPVAQIDVLPTLLGALGLAIPPQVEGRDVRPLIFADAPAAGEEMTQETAEQQIVSHLDLRRFQGEAILVGNWKLIVPRSEDFGREAQLYNLRTDPREQQNLASEKPEIVARLRERLRDHREQTENGLQAGQAELDPELEEQLRDLGYLD